MAEKIASLSRLSWMPDVNAKACYRCEKQFSSFRRKHHCRYCGLLFCAKCSKTNVILKNGVKLDRTCDKCLGVLTMPEIKNPQPLAQYPYFPKDNSVFIEEDQEDVITEPVNDTNIDLQYLFNDDIEYNVDNLELGDFANTEELENYLNFRCKENLKNAKAEDWAECLSMTIKDVVKNIKPSKKDAMNLNKYLRIVGFPVEDKCRFFKGIVFKRQLANKRMPSNIKNPRVLILIGSTGYFLGDKKIVALQKIIDQEDNYVKILVDLIKNHIRPDLILLENSMPFNILQELMKLGISVLLNVKKKILKLVSRLTSAKILNSINQSLYENSDYLGSCVEFWQQKIGNDTYCFFQANEGSNLCGSVLFNSLGVDKKVLKAIIMNLCVQYRSILLEKTLLSLFSIQKVNYEDFHSSGSSFVHVSTCRGKMCSRPKIHSIEYYSKNGKSLGDFIKYSLSNVLEKCENLCDKKLFDHKYYYYKNKGRVKITYSKQDEHFNSLQIYRECLVCSKKTQTQKLSDLAWKFSFNKFIDNFFHTGLLIHQTCSHSFYTKGKFVFALSNLSVNILYEKTNHYFIYRDLEYNPSIIQCLFEEKWKQLLDSGKSLLMELKPKKECFFNLSLYNFSEENCLEDGALINMAIRAVEQSFISVEDNYLSIKSQNPQDYLEVEYFKKQFFFHVSNLIIHLEGAMELLDNIETRKTLKDIEKGPLIFSVSKYYEIPCLLSKITDKFDLLKDKNFRYLQEGMSSFCNKDMKFAVNVEEEDSLSIIAYALSSNEYFDAMEDYEDNTEDICERIESDLLATKDEHFIFSDENYDYDGFSSDLQRESFREIYGDSISIKVVAYFYKQFHGMRYFYAGTHKDFLLSIAQARKEELRLGKSKAYFKNSVDERYIIKFIGERQFRMFTDFAPNYFRHYCKSKFHNMPSCLAKILGAFSIQIKNHTTNKTRQEYILINENLTYKQPKTISIYDLKGTINKRRKVQEGDEKTKMDLNYVEFTEGLPLILQAEDKKRLDAEIWNDTLFLSQQNIVDYSLLLILNIEKKVINYGIIDYMEQYTFERAIESKYKSVVGTEVPTIIYPKEYKNRFRQHMIQMYFMSVE